MSKPINWRRRHLLARVFSIIVLGAVPVVLAAQSLSTEEGGTPIARKELTGVIDSWSSRTGVVLDMQVRQTLVEETETAATEIRRLRPTVGGETIKATAPRALAKYLDRSLNEAQLPPIDQLTDEMLTGSGLLLLGPKLFRVLVVHITPADAALTINGRSFAHSSVDKYGIDGKRAVIEVSKEGYQACTHTVDLASEADTQISCILKPK